MAAPNTDPLFVLTPQVGFGTIAGANTSADFTTTTNAALVFTGGAQGSLLREVRIKFAPGANTVATVAKIWLNNGGTTATATNNCLIGEVSVPATTASTTGAQIDLIWTPSTPGLIIPATYRVYVAMAVWSTGTFYCSGIGGDF